MKCVAHRVSARRRPPRRGRSCGWFSRVSRSWSRSASVSGRSRSIRISMTSEPRHRQPRHRLRHRQKPPRPSLRRSRRSTQATRFSSSRTRTSPRLKVTSPQPRRQSPRQTLRPPRPAARFRQRRTRRPSCAPSSSKPGRSATWHRRSASRRESAREDRSGHSQPSEAATPKATRSSRPSRSACAASVSG